MSLFVLFESSIGYALFKLKDFDEANMTEKNVQSQIAEFETFSKMAKVVVIPSIYYLGFPSLRVIKCCPHHYQHHYFRQGPRGTH